MKLILYDGPINRYIFFIFSTFTVVEMFTNEGRYSIMLKNKTMTMANHENKTI